MTDRRQSLFLRALKREAVPRTPVWLMRQAGRYLPEYRKVRQEAGDFLSLCKNPQLACEVTLQPLRRYALDAAILFSDILTIPDAMGLGLYFAEGEGPGFHKPLRTTRDIEALPHLSIVDELNYVMEAVRLIRAAMPAHLPLIGFSGSPWTLACYMVEGKGSRDYREMLKLLYNQPLAAHALLDKLALAVTAYLQEQIRAGVDAVMLFDTWGGLLSTANYKQFSLHPMEKIVREIKQAFPHIPIILFTKGGGQWLEDMAMTGCDALGLDWTCDLQRARVRVGNQVALQGNLDPAVLLANESVIREEVGKVLASFGKGNGHVFNLGHGITPDVTPESVAAMIDAVHDYSPPYHQEDV
ncbi:uroporphyrinogen decarboxylase [Legionella taurinensis]|uniref:Uroporphyrinogen decarboxylase n=1 Tax=Legionella taurinensis TaxID=70611 RepID=A0A3A5L7A9_9GAMM|nr:uroporphyrinogen decarboxylase [Legionella taurinensis]MDX1836397.1 uroporphyrinogen decarboxylase [Legionella taurinensis]PUT43130.1 uroporphyrinogen decarboxylase [Legionella taurinensis]PUT45053.1 uroporphyrinogen decarboxylase [Legionella taurinensis]PUT45685.1 uroporphyrinogen decarboxylase [Legionella taurinensis]PUT49454.1 uroporphyrinogen decarboxylase [Legionella taurinensis]